MLNREQVISTVENKSWKSRKYITKSQQQMLTIAIS